MPDTPAIAYLKGQLQDQQIKLEAIEEEKKHVIRQGQEALREVNTQKQHVQSLTEAIRVLELAEKRKTEGPSD